MRITVYWEGMALKYWKKYLKQCWIFRIRLLSCGWVDVKFSPCFFSLPVLISLSTGTDDVCFKDPEDHICAKACHGEWAKKFWWKLEKGCERRDDQISSSISPRKCWSPPLKSLWDHNTSQETEGAWSAIWKGTASHRSEGVLNWGRERVEGKERFLINAGWMRVLSGQTYRNGVGGGKWGPKKGGLVVITWSMSTTPAPHSPLPEGSRPCCVNYRPPMDLLNQTGIRGRTVYSHCLIFTWGLPFGPQLCMFLKATNYIPD